MKSVIFFAELLETKQRKSASIDNLYTIKLQTDDGQILDLGKMPGDTLFKVTIEHVSERDN